MAFSSLTGRAHQKQSFFAIHGLRFIAAFWVLLFHASLHFGQLKRLAVIQPVISQGVLAMTLFFMLSGFILAYRYPGFGRPEDYDSYIAARVARLYPVYLFSGLLTLWRLSETMAPFNLADRFGPWGSSLFTLLILFLFVLSLQAWFPALFDVWNFGGSWSLSVEAFFYSLFPRLRAWVGSLEDLQLRALVYGMPLALMFILAGLLASYNGDRSSVHLFYVLPIFRLPEFVFGMAGYILFVHRRLDLLWLKRSALFLGPVLLIALFLGKDLPGLIDWGWLATLPFMGIFVLGTRLKAPESIQRVMNYLGRISYGVYMAQFSTIPLLKLYREEVSVEIAWVLLISSTLLLAVIMYHFVEVPLYPRTHRSALRLLSYLSGAGIKETIEAPE
jgi:peptidoglycan/LPS O-acetylase OafA/YrhL